MQQGIQFKASFQRKWGQTAYCNINCSKQKAIERLQIHVASFTEPSATKNYIGSPNNNATNFPDIYESPLHKRQRGTAFLVRFQRTNKGIFSIYFIIKVQKKQKRSNTKTLSPELHFSEHFLNGLVWSFTRSTSVLDFSSFSSYLWTQYNLFS